MLQGVKPSKMVALNQINTQKKPVISAAVKAIQESFNVENKKLILELQPPVETSRPCCWVLQPPKKSGSTFINIEENVVDITYRGS